MKKQFENHESYLSVMNHTHIFQNFTAVCNLVKKKKKERWSDINNVKVNRSVKSINNN